MSSFELEPEFVTNTVCNRIHERAGKIDNPTAPLTERVKMSALSIGVRQVIPRRPLPKVNVGNNAHVGERF
jgi:hypothetical protein